MTPATAQQADDALLALYQDPDQPERTHAYQAANMAAYLANSYTRLDSVIESASDLEDSEWFALLGWHWQCCDNIFRWRTFLRPLLASTSRENLDAMMTAEELEALAKLPETITVYRGCYQINRAGLSWTTDREVAQKFPSLMRYNRHLVYGDQPLLLTARVPRERAVLKLDREEAEIIPAIARVRPTAVELLPVWVTREAVQP